MKKSEALKILGLSEGASSEDIKKAHRSKVIENHPDRVTDPAKKAAAEEKTKLINEARDVLESGKWDPEEGSSPFYGTGYTASPYQQNGGRGYTTYVWGWPGGFTYQQGQGQGQGRGRTQGRPGAQSGPFDPFNPFAAQQAPVDAAKRAAAQAKTRLQSELILLCIKAAVVVFLALQGSWLGGLAIWALLTFMTALTKRFGTCIWMFIFPLFFMFPSVAGVMAMGTSNLAIMIPVLILFAAALIFDIKEIVDLRRRWKMAQRKVDKETGGAK